MAYDGTGKVHTSPDMTFPEGHIVNRGDVIDQVYERTQQGLDVSDLVSRPNIREELGYVAIEEPREIK